MSQHRAALAAILVAVVATITIFPGATSAAPTPVNPIISTALQYDGTWQGECWQYMKRVVFEATGRTVGFDYRQGYFEAGAIEVSVADAAPGDVIQLADDAYTAPDADYPGLHTAFIMENLGGGIFHVIESNRLYDGMVSQRWDYNPAAAASYRGINFHIYRFPVDGFPGPGGTTAPKTPPVVWRTGDVGIVNTPGDTLFLRSGPSKDTAILGSLPDGTVLMLQGNPITNGGIAWARVSTGIGPGWVAVAYLKKDESKLAAPTGNKTPVPVLTYRTFIPVTANDR